MKKVILMSLLGLMIGTTACEDNKDEFLSDYSTVMYIRDSGEQELTCYISGDKTPYSMPIVKAGNDDKAVSDAKVAVMEQAQLDVYNAEHYTDYLLLPASCYEFTSETNLTFTADEGYKIVNMQFIPEAIKALGGGNYVLPLVLTSSKQVNEDKNTVFIKPDAKDLVLSITPTESGSCEIAKSGTVITVPLQLQVENQWDFQAKVVVDETTTTLDTNSFTLRNDGIVNFSAGGNGTLEIEVSNMNQITGDIALKIGEVIGKDFVIDSEVKTITCTVEAYPLTAAMLSTNAQEPSEGSLANLLDNNVATYFHSAWSVSVADPHYVQVKLPETIKKFGFSYTNRSSNGNAALAWFNLYGGTSDDNLNVIKFYSWDGDGLPGGAAGEFTSTVLSVEEAIDQLRFEVYYSNWTGGAFFVWSEFKLYVLE